MAFLDRPLCSRTVFTWGLAVAKFPLSGNHTTSWTDDGFPTSVAPGLVPRRLYRTMENAQ